MSKAQRRKIALKNLSKARRSKGASKKAGRKASRRKSSGRKRSKRSVALANLAKGRAKQKRNKARGGPKHKVRAYRYRRPAKSVRVKSHMSYETKPKRRRRRKSRKASAYEAPKKRRSSRKRRRSSGKHRVRGHYARRKGGKRVRVRAHLSREMPKRRRRRSGSKRRRHSSRRRSSMRHYSRRRGYALENPLSVTEIAVGSFTGIVGFLAEDALDRVIATHALGPSASGAPGSDGKPLYGDTPGTTGAYAGLYNATAVLAPMDWKRWVAGGAMTLVPFAIAAFVSGKSAPVARSSLQFFGFGAGVRFLGKAATDLMAKLFGRTSWGARMYDGEARAAALKNGTDTSLFPTSGLGATPSLAQPHKTVEHKVAQAQPAARRPIPPPPPGRPGVGQTPQQHAPALPMPAARLAPPVNNNDLTLAGIPKLSAQRAHSRYSWGNDAAAE